MSQIEVTNTPDTLENKAFFRKRFYFGLLLVAIVVGVNALAHTLSLYWIYKWFDNPMHISGGVAVGYLSIFFWRVHVARKNARLPTAHATHREYSSRIFAAGIVGALIIGIAWEFLERAYGLSGFSGTFIFDTLKDLVNDMMGGIIAAMIWELSLLRSLRDFSAKATKSDRSQSL